MNAVLLDRTNERRKLPRHRHGRAYSATLRKRRYRQRLRQGLIVVEVEVSNEIIGLLLDTNYLPLDVSEDRSAIAKAIAEMLIDASKHERPHEEREPP